MSNCITTKFYNLQFYFYLITVHKLYLLCTLTNKIIPKFYNFMIFY